jgi:hypothetical protein
MLIVDSWRVLVGTIETPANIDGTIATPANIDGTIATPANIDGTIVVGAKHTLEIQRCLSVFGLFLVCFWCFLVYRLRSVHEWQRSFLFIIIRFIIHINLYNLIFNIWYLLAIDAKASGMRSTARTAAQAA